MNRFAGGKIVLYAHRTYLMLWITHFPLFFVFVFLTCSFSKCQKSVKLTLDTVACVFQRCRLIDVLSGSRTCRLWLKASKRRDVCAQLFEGSCCDKMIKLFLKPLLHMSLNEVHEVLQLLQISNHRCDGERWELFGAAKTDSMFSHVCADGNLAMNAARGFPLARNFESLMLKEPILRGVFAYGFETLSRIQRAVGFLFSRGQDMMVCCRAGTGKTALLGFGLLNQVVEDLKATQFLVLVASRELAAATTSLLKVQTVGSFVLWFVQLKSRELASLRILKQHVSLA